MGWHIAGGILAVVGGLIFVGVVQQEIIPMWRRVLREVGKEAVTSVLGIQAATLIIVMMTIGIPLVGVLFLIGGEPYD